MKTFGLLPNRGQILLISNMVIHRSITGPTHLLSADVQGPVSFAMSAAVCDFSHRPSTGSG